MEINLNLDDKVLISNNVDLIVFEENYYVVMRNPPDKC